MGVFNYIKEKKKMFDQEKRVKTTQRLKDAQEELKALNTERKIITQNKQLYNEYNKTKKALFEAKHPLLSAGISKAKKNLQENKKNKKGIFAENNTTNPFVSSGTSPFNNNGKKGKGKNKGPGQGIFY